LKHIHLAVAELPVDLEIEAETLRVSIPRIRSRLK
jgi:hypothetical protein